jgi:hypothetical protein
MSKKKNSTKPFKVNLGDNILDGFANSKLEKLKPDSVDFLIAQHVISKLERKDFIPFMDGCWKVLKDEAQLVISASYGCNALFIQDPMRINPVNENTWRYFDPLTEPSFWHFYKPKPWKVVQCVFDVNGNLEVALQKIHYEND